MKPHGSTDGLAWGVVLCGGQSQRMGSDKAALPHPTGGNYLEYAINRLLVLCDCVVVAGRQHMKPTDNAALATAIDHQRVVCLPDAEPQLGPLAGVVGAMQFVLQRSPQVEAGKGSLDSSALIVTPVDMPALATEDLQSLWRSWCEEVDRQQPTVATFDGQQIEPLVGVYPLGLSDELREWLTTASRSLWRWLQQRPHHLCQLSPTAAANINTPSERKRYEKHD